MRILSFLSAYYCIFSMENDVAIEGFSKDSFFFFSCSASLYKITTTDNLQKKQIIVVNWCYACKRCGEVADHFLLHSPRAYELWSLVFCLFGMHWIMPHRVIELFDFCGRVSLVHIAI